MISLKSFSLGFLGMAILTMMFVSMFVPWHTRILTGKVKGLGECTKRVYTYWDYVTVDCDGQCSIACVAGNRRWHDNCDINFCHNVANLYYGIKVAMGIAITLFVIALLGLPFRYKKGNPIITKVAGILSFIIAMCAVIAFAASYKTAVYNDHVDKKSVDTCVGPCKSFIGHESIDNYHGFLTVDYKWGPGSGWILALLSSILLLAMLLWVFLGVRKHYDTT